MENSDDIGQAEKVFDGPSRWSEIPAEELPKWSLRLAQEENVSIRQHPVFNQRFRRVLAKPVYLKCVGPSGDESGFACVLSFGCAGLKCGVVIDGPQGLGGRSPGGQQASALVDWFRSHGFAFVRLSHRDPQTVELFSSLPGSALENPLPFIPRYGGDLVIGLKADDKKILSGFQQIARRDIKHATEAQCEVNRTSDPEEFRKLGPVFLGRAQKKGFRIGKLDAYFSMFKESPQEDIVRLYTASYSGQPVYAVVFLRDCSTFHYLLGALDSDALGGNPTPSCLLHWTAMRDYRGLGCSWYNIGRPAGPVSTFKRKFRPVEASQPRCVTLILKPVAYRLWLRLVLPWLNRFSTWNIPVEKQSAKSSHERTHLRLATEMPSKARYRQLRLR